MPHLSGSDRSQMLLLPEAMDDYVSPDNPVRFISEGFGLGVVSAEEGGDGGLQIGHAAMNAATDPALGEQGEEALDLIDPGGAGTRH